MRSRKESGVPRTDCPLPEDSDEHAEEGREKAAAGRGMMKGEVQSSRFWSTVDGGDNGREASARQVILSYLISPRRTDRDITSRYARRYTT